MWLLQIPEKGNAGAVGQLPGWCSNTKGVPKFQARAETGQTGGSCTSSCWGVTMETAKFSATCWLAFVSELGDLVLEGTLHTALSPAKTQSISGSPCSCKIMWYFPAHSAFWYEDTLQKHLKAKITYENKATLKSPVYLIFLAAVHPFSAYLTAL